jgi:peptide/nickel transport system ATP-binding protein
MSGAALLEVSDLRVEFSTRSGKALVLNGVAFEIRRGETLCVVGESGCGKSMTALALLRLIPFPPGRISHGQVRFQGEDLLRVGEDRMRDVRGNRISMIFQEPMTSLNPVFTVGEQIGESLRLHAGLDGAAARARAIEMLQQVGIPAPERRVDEYPHQLSGGMRQRVMIAMALACDPKVLIADEPTTALDVTIQAGILDLMRDLRQRLDTAIVLITHDLGVVADIADRVVVMYAGRKVEEAPVEELFAHPLHPYTVGLMAAIPTPGAGDRRRLQEIPGMVPSLAELPRACAFADRCPRADERSRTAVPPLEALRPQHLVACFHPGPDVEAVA